MLLSSWTAALQQNSALPFREKNIPETLQKVPALYPCVSRTQPEVTSPELEHQGTLHRTADASVTQLKRRGTRISNPKV